MLLCVETVQIIRNIRQIKLKYITSAYSTHISHNYYAEIVGGIVKRNTEKTIAYACTIFGEWDQMQVAFVIVVFVRRFLFDASDITYAR